VIGHAVKQLLLKRIKYAEEVLQLVQLFMLIEQVKQGEVQAVQIEFIRKRLGFMQLRQDVLDVHDAQGLTQLKHCLDVESPYKPEEQLDWQTPL